MQSHIGYERKIIMEIESLYDNKFNRLNKTIRKDNDFNIISQNRTKIMGIASLWILVFHCWQPIINNNNNLSMLEIFIKRIGFCGVDIFLLLSGMGLVNSIKKGKKQYYYNRLKRILFTYILVSFYAIGIYRWDFVQTIQNVFFYNYFTHNIYSFLWFVPTILIFYLLFPIYYKQFENSKNKNYFIIISICIWLVFAYLLKENINEQIYGIINRIPIFITGIWIGWFCKEKKFKFPRYFLLANIAILIIGLQLSYLTNFKYYYILLPVSNALVNYLITLPITIIFATIFNMCTIDCINNFFEFFGIISFHLYCIQEMFFTFFVGIITKLNIIILPPIVINILFISFAVYLSKMIFLLEKYFWDIIEKKMIK